ncbi:MAG: S8 family serine peptidase [Anaerolineae bacterium]|nr:S8 family serine peptidase [Anaerolineae bacterium]
MTALSVPRPDRGRWLGLFLLAGWLAVVPPLVVGGVSLLAGAPPYLWVQLSLLPPAEPLLPGWAIGLISIGGSLALHLSLFVPVYGISRRPGREFLHLAVRLMIVIALSQALGALAALPLPGDVYLAGPVRAALLRFALVVPFLLVGMGHLEARRRGGRLQAAWRRFGLCRPPDPAVVWLALAAGAVVAWPWVVVGSLGSPSTTAANLLMAVPDALGEELLFRGVALAWLLAALQGEANSRRRAAAGSLLLFVAAQGGAILPAGDWAGLLRFLTALPFGLLALELTIRGGGSIWPAVAVHLIYRWFRLAFVDPRSQEEVLHWLASAWMPLAAGGLGLILWLWRRAGRGLTRSCAPAGAAILAWAVVAILYLAAGAPGFYPDGLFVVMAEQADLGAAASISDPGERRAWVYHTLVETAEASQAALCAELDRRRVRYRPHYLINAVEVLERPGLRHALETQPGVAAVLFQPGMRRYPRTWPLPVVEVATPVEIPWNLRAIGADQVWRRGYTGQGVVVGIADTGVVWDHPALRGTYFGSKADGTQPVHDYAWYDAWGERPAPWDDVGHGTHTLGIVLGKEGEAPVGVAPGAFWIACRAMRHGLGNPGSYLACMEFLFAPFPLAGDPLDDGDPARGAGVVVHAWGCPAEEGCRPGMLRLAAEHLRAAGQMLVASAGNDGPACGSVDVAPALYETVLTVGAITQHDRAAPFSSRGPAASVEGQSLKPDLVAPGEEIVSSVPGGYGRAAGTSAAAPHVAGAVALLWSMDPSLAGDVAATRRLLLQTAYPLKIDAACQGEVRPAGVICGCDGDGWDSVPNQVYGWGRLDVWAAAEAEEYETR